MWWTRSGIRFATSSLQTHTRKLQSSRHILQQSRKMQTSNLAALKALPSHEAMYPHGLTSLAIPSKKMPSLIQSLGTASIEEFQESKFVKPQSIIYELEGEKRRWDVVESHDSIAVVLYHVDMKSMLLVRQFRPALYATLMRAAAKEGKSIDVPLAQGFTCELCAGLVDKEKPMEEIVREEILEECGYDVPVASISKITTYAAGVGVQGAQQSLFYASIREDQKVQESGGLDNDGERIELLALPVDNIEKFVVDYSVSKTTGAMFGLLWAKSQLLTEA